MEIERAVFDAGPLIHLAEIDNLNLLDIVKEKVAPEIVIKEFRGHRIEDMDLFVLSLNDKGKEHSNILMKEYHLDIGEAEAISLAKQFLTLGSRYIKTWKKLYSEGSVIL